MEVTLYEIVVAGQLEPHWSEWFEHMAISSPAPGRTLLRGPLADQSALFGVLRKLHDLGLVLVSVECVFGAPPAREG
jgi:hypothetical protein